MSAAWSGTRRHACGGRIGRSACRGRRGVRGEGRRAESRMRRTLWGGVGWRGGGGEGGRGKEWAGEGGGRGRGKRGKDTEERRLRWSFAHGGNEGEAERRRRGSAGFVFFFRLNFKKQRQMAGMLTRSWNPIYIGSMIQYHHTYVSPSRLRSDHRSGVSARQFTTRSTPQAPKP